MIKYFCDKCGKECEDYDVFTIKVIPPEFRTWMDDTETGTYILCYGCVRKFNKWIHELPDSKYIAMKQEQER